MQKIKNIIIGLLILVAVWFVGTIAPDFFEKEQPIPQGVVINAEDLPNYDGEHYRTYTKINNNIPYFTEEEYTTESFERYGPLDDLGRCTVVYANIGRDLMPTKERGDIHEIRPTGWKQEYYDFIDGEALYNRCHLIGHQLTGEDANERNLLTGTRYFNAQGMLPFENMVADYIKETDNHVLYRVTPVFKGDELLARGVQMEAYSVEDNGAGICFNVFIHNIQPRIELDYTDGSNRLIEGYGNDSQEVVATDGEIRGNANSKIYHCPGQEYYEGMLNSRHLVIFENEQDAIDAGYRKAKK